jgi:putative acetyltransferase
MVAEALSKSYYMHIRNAHAAEADSLFETWLRSVRATHAFLTEEDIQSLIPLVREYIHSSVESFWVITDAADAPIGFMGMTGNEIDALFLDPDHLRHGGGRALVNHARTLSPELTVSVNEQNPAAIQFYVACGFEVVGRSDTDGQGRPFPLLHLRLRTASTQ